MPNHVCLLLLPSPHLLQADELQELSVLANDAAEILWEMVAMGEVRCCCAARSCFTLFCAAETSIWCLFVIF